MIPIFECLLLIDINDSLANDPAASSQDYT